MNAKEVVDKILADGQASAEQIKKDGEDKLSSLRSEYASEETRFDDDTQILIDKAVEDRKLRILAAARMDSTKKVLAQKKSSIDAIFSKAKDSLCSEGNEQYLDLMLGLIKKSLETGDEVVVTGKSETRINDEFIKRVNRELGAGFKGNLRLEPKTSEIEGGFILKRGKVSINVSIEVLLDLARESLESEFAKELFV